MIKEKDEELDKLKFVLGLNDLSKRLSGLEGPVKRHPWSVQFLELRALNQDFTNLKQLPQSIIRDNLISDIEAYLSTGETLCHSLELKEAKISELTSVIDEYDIVVRDLQVKCESYVKQIDALKANRESLNQQLRVAYVEMHSVKTELFDMKVKFDTLSNGKIPFIRLFKS